jgi:hypothetical protein
MQRALKHLRLGGMAAVLETRRHQAQAEPMAPIDLISCLVSDELTRRTIFRSRKTLSRTFVLWPVLRWPYMAGFGVATEVRRDT